MYVKKFIFFLFFNTCKIKLEKKRKIKREREREGKREGDRNDE